MKVMMGFGRGASEKSSLAGNMPDESGVGKVFPWILIHSREENGPF